MLFPLLAVLVGLCLLVWSADRFIDGAAYTARHYAVPPLLVGMLIVGFGTSAPEMVVSVLAASQGNSGLALGNAWGSNIVNIALILGVTALISPIVVQSGILRKELPILSAITLLSVYLAWDGQISQGDAMVLLAVFGLLLTWSVIEGMRGDQDSLGTETEDEISSHGYMTLKQALFWLSAGLLVLVLSSRLLVWGAVSIAQSLGVSDLIIGLTIVALGTSLPELASCIAAARKNEHDLALGNVLGSNLFNSLVVVGLAGAIHPIAVGDDSLIRDLPVMLGLTLVLFVMGWGWRGRAGRINRWEAGALLLTYLIYTGWLLGSLTTAS